MASAVIVEPTSAPTVSSATPLALAPGVLKTTMPFPVQSSMGMLLVPAPARAVSLVERFGQERAMADTLACVREVVAPFLVT